MHNLDAMVVSYDEEIFKDVPNISETSEMEEYLDDDGGTDSEFINDLRKKFDVDEEYLEQIASNIRRRHIMSTPIGKELKFEVESEVEFALRTYELLHTLSRLLEDNKIEEAKEIIKTVLEQEEE